MAKKSTISFRQDMLDLILAGKKTVTIRPVKPQPVIIKGQHPYGVTNVPYNAGDIITVRENKNIKLKVISIYLIRLQYVNYETWLKDRLSIDTEEFDYISREKHWNSFYGNTEFCYMADPFVWVIEFELVRADK